MVGILVFFFNLRQSSKHRDSVRGLGWPFFKVCGDSNVQVVRKLECIIQSVAIHWSLVRFHFREQFVRESQTILPGVAILQSSHYKWKLQTFHQISEFGYTGGAVCLLQIYVLASCSALLRFCAIRIKQYQRLRKVFHCLNTLSMLQC